MRKFMTLLTVVLTTLSFVSHAQTKIGKISGLVIDGNARTIESATITLLRAKDSSVAKMNVADKTGKYFFDGVMEGKYLVSVTAVGHQKAFSELVEISAQHPEASVHTIELILQVKSIDGVTIVSKKPLIEQKIDRTVVNVDASVTNVGSTALEVLEKSPGVTVDKDDNISLKGKAGVQIYIDGRPSYLSGPDLANLLRSMNANQLDQIEIMTNPPAKYDAAGNAGIINIKTKKNKQFGYNGSVSLGYSQGQYARASDGLNFNYRKNKLNLFTNLSHNFNTDFQNLNIQRKFRDVVTKQLLSSFDQKNRIKNERLNYSGKIGFDYFASKKTTFGAVFSGFQNRRFTDNLNTTIISDANLSPLSQTLASSNSTERWKNYSANFNVRHTIDTTGQEISADLDYVHYGVGNNQSLTNSYFDPSGNRTNPSDTLLGNLPQTIAIYSAKADYTLPLKKNAKFEAGAKSSFVRTDNNALYDSVKNGQMVRDYNRSNHFKYQENVNALYANFSRPLGKKWNAQLGLRLENTHSSGNQITTGINFDRNYTQLFPTAYLQYTLDKKNEFVLNYGRRVERPDYADLNPFIQFLDRYTYEQGNPDLKPQFSHNIELTHTYGGFLTTTLNYTRTTDIIQDVIEQHETTNETYIKKSNIAQMRQYGISLSAYKQWTKWWNGNVYANFYNNRFSGVVNGDNIVIGISTLQLQAQQQFKLSKTLTAEISGFYQTKALEGVIFVRPLGQMSAGLSKQILKGKGTLRLNVRDIFYSQIAHGYSKYGNVDIAFQQRHDSRVANIGFTYRFGKGKVNNTNKHENGSSDEQNRVKAGGN